MAYVAVSRSVCKCVQLQWKYSARTYTHTLTHRDYHHYQHHHHSSSNNNNPAMHTSVHPTSYSCFTPPPPPPPSSPPPPPPTTTTLSRQGPHTTTTHASKRQLQPGNKDRAMPSGRTAADGGTSICCSKPTYHPSLR